MTKAKIRRPAMAFTTDGKMLVHLAHLVEVADLAAILKEAKKVGGTIFIGVEVPRKMRAEFARDLRDVLDDVVGRLGPRVHQPKRSRR